MSTPMLEIPFMGMIAWLVVSFAIGFGSGGGFTWLKMRRKNR